MKLYNVFIHDQFNLNSQLVLSSENQLEAESLADKLTMILKDCSKDHVTEQYSVETIINEENEENEEEF